MPTPQPPSHETLIHWQQNLEAALEESAGDLDQATARCSEPRVREATATYLHRPSKRLHGMAFLHTAHMLQTPYTEGDLTAVAAAVEVRHGAILLHDDIVDGDTHRGGRPTAHHALRAPFGAEEATGAALFAGDILAALAPLPLLRSNLPTEVRLRLADLFQTTTAQVAAGQIEQLDLDTRRNPATVTQEEILTTHAAQFVPYLGAPIQLACLLADVEADAIDRITEAVKPLCQAFQVQNDLAGFTELTRTLATPDASALTLANTSDLARRRRTAVVHAALNRLPPGDRQQLLSYLNGTSHNLRAAADLIETSGAVEHCSALIRDLQQGARELLVSSPLPPHAGAALESTWNYMTSLYDPASPVSSLYLHARADLTPAIDAAEQ